MDDGSRPAPRSERWSHTALRLNERLSTLLCRAFALVFFAVGVSYWAALIGIDPDWRFDLMPVWWKTAAPAFAVLYPVAGLGLWLMAGWAPAVWVLLVLGEGIVRIGFPGLFGVGLGWLALQVWGLAMLLALKWIGRRERYASSAS